MHGRAFPVVTARRWVVVLVAVLLAGASRAGESEDELDQVVQAYRRSLVLVDDRGESADPGRATAAAWTIDAGQRAALDRLQERLEEDIRSVPGNTAPGPRLEEFLGYV